MSETEVAGALDGPDELVAEFLAEGHERLDVLDRALVGLESDATPAGALDSGFRALHTIKGTSGMLGFGGLEALAHAGEGVLARLRDGELSPTPAVMGLLFETADVLRNLLASIERTGGEDSGERSSLVRRLGAVSPASDSEGDVEVPRLGDLLIQRGLVSREQLEDTLAQQHQIRRSVVEDSIRVDLGVLDTMADLTEELVRAGERVRAEVAHHPALGPSADNLSRIATELEATLAGARLQRVDEICARLPRLVRDLAVSLGKKVDLRTRGAGTELDRVTGEAVREALTHLVRNAVDHGIEPPAERRRAGKPERGTVRVRAHRGRQEVVLEVSDDGSGIDADRVRELAVSRGVAPAATVGALSNREAADLVFSPGLSTAPTVTVVSGRGVGMDVVRSSIEKVNGRVEIESEPGVGTAVRLVLPTRRSEAR